MPQETPPPSFEAALARLEAIAALLDRNDVPLADALALCAEAAVLTRACRELLAQAEGKLEQLIESDGRATLAPLEEG